MPEALGFCLGLLKPSRCRQYVTSNYTDKKQMTQRYFPRPESPKVYKFTHWSTVMAVRPLAVLLTSTTVTAAVPVGHQRGLTLHYFADNLRQLF